MSEMTGARPALRPSRADEGEVVTGHSSRYQVFGGPTTQQPSNTGAPPTNLFELAEAASRCMATANAIDSGLGWETFARTKTARLTYQAIQARGLAQGVRWTLLMLGLEAVDDRR